jgi:hypothetical protein
VGRPVARYTPSRRYLLLAVFALSGGALSAWTAVRWTPAWIAAGLFAVSAAAVLILALRPAIEIRESHLLIGRLAIPWGEIRRIDQTGWNAPLAVYVTLLDQRRILLVHSGDLDSSTSLLRHLRKYSREALLDGIPYRQFWGEAPAPKQLLPPRYPLLRPEDEEEVERLFQRLKTVGRLDQRGSDDR